VVVFALAMIFVVIVVMGKMSVGHDRFRYRRVNAGELSHP
jgi:hypothetical protein